MLSKNYLVIILTFVYDLEELSSKNLFQRIIKHNALCLFAVLKCSISMFFLF